MKGMNEFERKARCARADAPPDMDVMRRVLNAIADLEGRPVPDPFGRQMALCAAFSAAIALVVAAPALQAWAHLTDPMAELFGVLVAGL